MLVGELRTMINRPIPIPISTACVYPFNVLCVSGFMMFPLRLCAVGSTCKHITKVHYSRTLQAPNLDYGITA